MGAPVFRTRKAYINKNVTAIGVQRIVGPGLRRGGFGNKPSIIGVDRTRVPKEVIE